MHRISCAAVVLSCLSGGLVAYGENAKPASESQTPAKTPDCVYVGTPHDVVDKMLEMAKITKDDVVYDPGCGDGRIVTAAAKRYGCRGVGYEIDPNLAAEARRLAKKRKVDHLVRIMEQDIFIVDYSPATVIEMYLLPEMIVKLLPQLEKLKPGSRVVAHDYPIRGAAADNSVEVTSSEDGVKHSLYLYTLPLKKSP
jgi:protein-L-isoaspartate O-methyltransferase